MRWLVACLITSTSGFTPPSYCNRSFLEVTKAEPVQAKRYAVVLNRHCYRGFSGIDYRNKDAYVGTQRAVDMQLALINSVLGNVVLPLEHLGFEVDVFLVAHDPAPHNSTKSAELWDLLIRAFGGRVVATTKLRGLRALGGDGGRDLGQGTAMVETFRLLEKHSMKLASQNYFPHNESRASPYRAVLINRFDVAFTDKLGPADRQDLAKTNYPTDAAHYALWSAKRPSFVMNMIASLPGWLLGCYFSHALHSPDMFASCVETNRRVRLSRRWRGSSTPSSRRGASTQAARRVVDREGRALLAPASLRRRAEAEQ